MQCNPNVGILVILKASSSIQTSLIPRRFIYGLHLKADTSVGWTCCCTCFLTTQVDVPGFGFFFRWMTDGFQHLDIRALTGQPLRADPTWLQLPAEYWPAKHETSQSQSVKPRARILNPIYRSAQGCGLPQLQCALSRYVCRWHRDVRYSQMASTDQTCLIYSRLKHASKSHAKACKTLHQSDCSAVRFNMPQTGKNNKSVVGKCEDVCGACARVSMNSTI